ncbi:hypothetical protein C0J52_11323 [Blattella germanica]|nr:hypothetical protein C0J52_11323 [Blattella germanica]
MIGLVVVAEPEDACKKILGPPNDPNYFGRWIVLIKRYGCPFEDKIRHAQSANFSAAIVHNVNSSELEPMSAKNPSGIFIQSVFVGQQAGTFLKEKYLYNSSYYILINDDLPFDINTHLLLPFAIVVAICFLVMVIFMVVKCIKDRRRQRRHQLPVSSLQQIPTAKFAKGDPYETCAICLEDYQEGEKLRILPCSHAYHSKCIDPWLTRNRRVCPVCKRRVCTEGEQEIETDSDSDADDTTPLVQHRANDVVLAHRRRVLEALGMLLDTASQAANNPTSSSSSSSPPSPSTSTSSSYSDATKFVNETQPFVITSSDEHSINTALESQEELVHHVDAEAIVVTPSGSLHSNFSV